MNNVGDIKTFTVAAAPPGGNNLTYVWKWWDNTVDVTVVPTVDKKLNVGGVNLPVTCQYCNEFGAYSTLTTSVTVNSPPVIIGNAVITANDRLFPFSTQMETRSYDPEAAGALSFAWYVGNQFIGSGTTTIPSAGTYRNYYTWPNVNNNLTFTQRITDANAGVTALDYSIRGYAPTGLTGGGSAISNSIISNTNNLGEVVIGPGQTVTFTVYAIDLNPGQLQFTWSLQTYDGWTFNYTTVQTPAQLSNGSYRSQIVIGVAAQYPGLKTARCTVLNVATGQSIELKQTVQLNASQTPVIHSVSTDAPVVGGVYSILNTSYVHFTGTATDRNNLLLNYRWDFWEPPNVQLWGKTVMLRPDQYDYYSDDALAGGPRTITGNLTVFDRFNATAVVPFQSFVTVQVTV